MHWYDSNWRASHPGSMEWANFETHMFQNGTVDACPLNTSITGTCGQGRVPVIGVDALSVGDIQAAVGFAVEHSLKLVVKNTGYVSSYVGDRRMRVYDSYLTAIAWCSHDLIGRSAARGSFVVWTHNMKDIIYDTAFMPQGAPGHETFQAVTLGAGVQWHEAYAAVNRHGRLMVGGISPSGSVGAAGGWLAGGGHSFLSPSYGLGVDNALEISVVLSTGEYLTTNEYQNQDLFWALRGGGGGTYGIVTSVTYHTYPIVPVQAWAYQANITNSSVLPELVEGLLRYQTQFTDDGWGGYGWISSQRVEFTYFAPNMTNETVTTATQAWRNFTQSLASYGVVSADTTTYHSSWFYLLHRTLVGGWLPEGASVLISSRLLSRDTVANNYTRVAQVLIDCNASFTTVAGGRVSQFGADSAGLNPAWRNAVVQTFCGISWDEESSSTQIKGMIQQLRGWIKAMYDVTPNDGAYFNEASPFEIDWQNTFFGAHYSTLKSIKDKYDPYRLFVVAEGVGSEDWNTNLTCRYGTVTGMLSVLYRSLFVCKYCHGGARVSRRDFHAVDRVTHKSSWFRSKWLAQRMRNRLRVRSCRRLLYSFKQYDLAICYIIGQLIFSFQGCLLGFEPLPRVHILSGPTFKFVENVGYRPTEPGVSMHNQ
ncbi:hypothetical protein J3R83DRAFT_9214 [Lanmaoa asiatica]|nr:hypothetical protein J3R83DRAFT_9214 [Lanmaoa asiatica]